MRLAISNIAWEVADDEDLLRLLKQYGVDAIDIAPGKYFPAPAAGSS
jgi:D-psicose/D-tagatose/L-ribulose 3-epimerase